MTKSSNKPAVRLRNVTKQYGATRALESISLDVVDGSIHAFVGENGAGKSTALGILAGRTPATSGTIDIFGNEPRAGDPRASRRLGVVAIYQELTVVAALSVEANVFLGQTVSVAGILAERAMRRRYETVCAQVGVRAVAPRTRAGSLSIADQQVIEILRAVVSDARVILLDEPTAALADGERKALYRLLKQLRAAGVTIIFVSHNLDEVLELSDDISVFRDGRLRMSAPRGDFTKATLVQAMIGDRGDTRVVRELLDDDELRHATDSAQVARERRLAAHFSVPPILHATGVTVSGAIDDVEIEVRAGELVGVGGLVGSGRSTLLRALAGVEPVTSGRMYIDGREVPWPKSVRQALSYGIALVPEDRKAQGLVLSMSAVDNIALSGFGRASKFGVLSKRSVEKATVDIARSFGFQMSRLQHAAWQLSGGNQQKLLLARWKHVTPRILLADEPTRGIDIGAKAEIMGALEAMAEEGLGLVIVSSELEEVAAVADRVFVLSEGRPVGMLDRTEGAITAADILDRAFRSAEHAVTP